LTEKRSKHIVKEGNPDNMTTGTGRKVGRSIAISVTAQRDLPRGKD
jgi:hypothetical protein